MQTKLYLFTLTIFVLITSCFNAHADVFGFQEILHSKQLNLDEIETALKKKYRLLAKEYHPGRPRAGTDADKFVDMKAAFDQANNTLEQWQKTGRPRINNQGNWTRWTGPNFDESNADRAANAAKERAAADAKKRAEAQAKAEAVQRERERAQAIFREEKLRKERLARAAEEQARRAQLSMYEFDYYQIFNIDRETKIELIPNLLQQAYQNPQRLIDHGYTTGEVQRLVADGIEIFTDQGKFTKLMMTLQEKGIISFAEFEQTLESHRARLRSAAKRNPYQNCMLKMHNMVGNLVDIKV